MFSALHHRNFRLFWSGNLVSLIGTWMQTIALSWLTYRLTHSAFLLGLVSFANAIPIFPMTPFGGVITDRVNKQKLVIITQTSAMILAFILAALTQFGHITIWQIFFITLLSGAISAVDMPARQAFVVEMVGKEDLMNAIALNSLAFNSARIVGPSIAAFTVYFIHESGCFWINGISFLAVLLSLFIMKFPPFVPHPHHQDSYRKNFKDAIDYVKQHKVIKSLMALVAVPSILTLSYAVLLPIFAKEIYHRDVGAYGVLYSCIGIGAVTGALTVAKLSKHDIKGKLLISGAISSCIMIFAFALSPYFPLSCVILAMIGFSNMALLVTTNTLIQTHVTDIMRGRVLSFYLIIFQGLMPIGSLVLGSIATYLHAPATIALCASITLCYVLYLNWRVPQLRQLA
jgi:MFS family permease